MPKTKTTKKIEKPVWLKYTKDEAANTFHPRLVKRVNILFALLISLVIVSCGKHPEEPIIKEPTVKKTKQYDK